MSCIGCTQKIIAANAEKEKKYQEAIQLANETKQWYAIYTDERGREQVIRYDLINGHPITRVVSPQL